MKRVNFEILAPIGGVETRTEGTVADLLAQIPYLLSSHIIPPLDILNDVLNSGVEDAGMSGGCRWPPFKLNAADFKELCAVLEVRNGEGYAKFVAPPEWVLSLEEWRHWVMEYCYHIPAKVNLEFSREIARLENEKKEAQRLKDRERTGALSNRIADVAVKQSDWIARHRRPHIWKR
jgi:hypothetical protein